MQIVDQLVITTEKLPLVVKGKPYYAQLESSGGDPSKVKVWSVATDSPFALPNGITLTNNTLEGTTENQAGNFPVKFQVTDGQQIATKEL